MNGGKVGGPEKDGETSGWGPGCLVLGTQSLLVMCSRNSSAEGAASSRVWDTERLHNKGVLQLLGGGQCGPRAEVSSTASTPPWLEIWSLPRAVPGQ